MSAFRRRVGIVVEFDDASGLGRIRSGEDLYRFHCVEIADGTRTISVGAEVEFGVEPRMGSYEATNILSTATG